MTVNLPNAEHGCLLLADITGYSSYLEGSELEHAQDVLADLLETMVEGVEPPLRLSKLEGDAAFAYAPTDTVSAPMLLDTVESTYFAFRRRVRDIRHATTCECDACVLIPTLDLKFFIHAGQYVVRRIARSEELTGSDVVLVHRLLKGTASEAVEGPAFAAYTSAIVEAMDLDVDTLGFVPHTEQLPGVGDVAVFVQDLERRWVAYHEGADRFVTAEDALYTFTAELPAPQATVWEWLTDPRKRVQWQDGVTNVDESVKGSRGLGTVNHCAHGPEVSIQEIVGWRPFDSFTTVDEPAGVPARLTVTMDLEATPTGTRCSVRYLAEPSETWPGVRDQVLPATVRSFESLEGRLAEMRAAK